MRNPARPAAAFAPFWRDEFDAREFVRGAIAQSSASLQRLQAAVTTVESALRAQVCIVWAKQEQSEKKNVCRI